MFGRPWPWLRRTSAQLDFVFGTRIHGNVAAILAGTPAFVLAHDTRTLELASYFEHPPSGHVRRPRPTPTPRSFHAEADYGPLARRARRPVPSAFIGLRRGSRLCAIVFEPGEDPTAFDRRIAAIDFPPAVRVRRNVLLHRLRGRSGRLLRRVSRSVAPAARCRRTRRALTSRAGSPRSGPPTPVGRFRGASRPHRMLRPARRRRRLPAAARPATHLAIVGTGMNSTMNARISECLGPGRVRDVGRPDGRLAGRDPRPVLADADPAAALDDDEPGRVRAGVGLDARVAREGELGDRAARRRTR